VIREESEFVTAIGEKGAHDSDCCLGNHNFGLEIVKSNQFWRLTERKLYGQFCLNMNLIRLSKIHHYLTNDKCLGQFRINTESGIYSACIR
jgi:hypothetical protein